MKVRAVVTSTGLVAATLVLVGLPTRPASAGGGVTIPVTIAEDVIDAGDGETSLREAVTQANLAPNQDTTIDVDPGLDPVLDVCVGPGDEDLNGSGDLDLTGAERVFITGDDGHTITQTCPGQRVVDQTSAGGQLWLSRMAFTGGDASGDGGGVLSAGGIVVSLGAVVEGNHADGAGGGVSAGTFASISQGTVRGNTADGAGGGVHAGGDVTITVATVSGNAAGTNGGGFSAGANATIDQATVTQNRAGGAGGAGRTNGFMDVTTSTVYANRASSGANLTAPGGVDAVASIIALGSGSSDCNQAGGLSGGYNVGSDGTCGAQVSGDAPNLHPMLAPLSDLGSVFTEVRRPVVGSPAVDRDAAPCSGEPQDQNLNDRDANLFCTSGAWDPAPQACASSGFPDVGESNPFELDVCWLARMGITGGYPDGGFHPSDAVTRQSMSAFIFRLAGAPLFPAPSSAVFTDVGVNHPFATEIAWMVDEGIADGYQDGTFRGGAPVSRQAMSAFLFRVAGEPPFADPGSPTFPDVGPTHPFFTEVEWLVSRNITGGYADGTFKPANAVSRQAMAAFLHRMAAEVQLLGL